jgi:hypothetical protein
MSERTATDPIDTSTDDVGYLVAKRLRSSGYPCLGSVKCQVTDGVIVLSGIVPTFFCRGHVSLSNRLNSQTW